MIMLLKYNVSNFRAIGHTVEYSMFPLAYIQDDTFLTTIHTKIGEWKVLRRGAIFGPNASGKSTFIKSLRFTRDFVLNPRKSGTGTGITQFEGDFIDLEYKSTFQFVFFINGEVYQYGFSLDKKQVNEEWLMILTKKNFVSMFERVTDEAGKSDITIGAKLTRKNSKNRPVKDR